MTSQEGKPSDVERYNGEDLKPENKSMGIGGLIIAIQGRKKYTGGWDEDIHSAILRYGTMSKMCLLIDVEMGNYLPFMLDGDALTYNTDIHTHNKPYESIIHKLKSWCTSAEKSVVF